MYTRKFVSFCWSVWLNSSRISQRIFYANLHFLYLGCIISFSKSFSFSHFLDSFDLNCFFLHISIISIYWQILCFCGSCAICSHASTFISEAVKFHVNIGKIFCVCYFNMQYDCRNFRYLIKFFSKCFEGFFFLEVSSSYSRLENTCAH